MSLYKRFKIALTTANKSAEEFAKELETSPQNILRIIRKVDGNQTRKLKSKLSLNILAQVTQFVTAQERIHNFKIKS